MFGWIVAVGLFTWSQLTWLASRCCNFHATFWRVYRFDISFGRTYVSSRNFSTMIWNYELPRNSHLQMQLCLYTIFKVEPPCIGITPRWNPPIVLGHGPCNALGQILVLPTSSWCCVWARWTSARSTWQLGRPGDCLLLVYSKGALEFRTRWLLWRKWTYAIPQVWPIVV